MKISYHDYSDQSYHGYQYYHGFVKISWKCKKTDTHTLKTFQQVLYLEINKLQIQLAALSTFFLL